MIDFSLQLLLRFTGEDGGGGGVRGGGVLVSVEHTEKPKMALSCIVTTPEVKVHHSLGPYPAVHN